MWARSQLTVPGDPQYLFRDARDFSLLHGLTLRIRESKSDNCVQHIPVTLFPSPFPRRLYNESLQMQPIINRLMLKIATDQEFLCSTLNNIAQVDDFTRNLLNINNVIQKEGPSQSIISCINRSDYMMHKADSRIELKQVEVNAIASGMSGVGHNTEALHRYIMNKYRIKCPDNCQLPRTSAKNLVSQGIIQAHDAYGKADTFVLMIIEDRSINYSDQFCIELLISKTRLDVRILRRSFSSLAESVNLGPNKELMVDGNKEISSVYFRYGYDPSNYNFQGAWDLRLLIERSRAIKCPSINFHLSGAKKFQHVLNDSKQLEKYLSSQEAELLAKNFCKIWSIESDTAKGNEGFQMGLTASKNLVLKPQREGGGHNIFGNDIGPYLRGITDPHQRSQYILMEYIDSPLEKNCLLLHNDDPLLDPGRLDKMDNLVSELGIYGSIIADGTEIKSSDHAGYLVRSKKFGVNEGGVAAGFAGLSSLILVDDERKDFDHSRFYV